MPDKHAGDLEHVNELDRAILPRFPTKKAKSGDDGIAVFCGISLLLATAAVMLSWLGLAGPMFY